jgi:hypothetical protein
MVGDPRRNESKVLGAAAWTPDGNPVHYAGAPPPTAPAKASLIDWKGRAATLERVRLASAFAIERTQAISDAVRLAAEQVQDVRLTGLDKCTQVTATDVLLPILIAMTSEAALAGAVVAAATSIVYGGMA